MAQGIDFMAIARGREQALSDNFADIQRLQQQDQYLIRREQQMGALEEARLNRAASTYTAPWLANMQRLTQAGLNPVDAFLQNQQTVLSDPNFQSMPPEVQSRVLQQINNFAAPLAQNLVAAGDIQGVQRLAASVGTVNPVSPLTAAVASGNVNDLVAAAGGKLSPDGQTVEYLGQQIPTSLFALRVAQAQSPSGGLTATEETRRAGIETSVGEQERQRQLNDTINFGLITGTLQQLPNGMYRATANPNVLFQRTPTGLQPVTAAETTGIQPATTAAAAFDAASGTTPTVAAPAIAASTPEISAPAAMGAGAITPAFARLVPQMMLANQITQAGPELLRSAGQSVASLTNWESLANTIAINAGQSDTSAISHWRRLDSTARTALLLRLQQALSATTTSPAEKQRIQAALDRYQRL